MLFSAVYFHESNPRHEMAIHGFFYAVAGCMHPFKANGKQCEGFG
jgi:hypothetical protein